MTKLRSLSGQFFKLLLFEPPCNLSKWDYFLDLELPKTKKGFE